MSLDILKGVKAMGERATIRKAKQRLLDAMANTDPQSEEYGKLTTELEKITKSELNQNGWKGQLGCGIIQTLISGISSSINVWSVLRHEDRGNVVTTKSLNYAPRPQEHNNSINMNYGSKSIEQNKKK